MRPIKFRAWDGKEMLYFELFPNPDPINIDSFYYNAASLVPMQYTGLVDRNGKEIYEGDIVRVSEHLQEKVRWENSSCGFEPFAESKERCPCTGGWQPEDCEIIGNIYENPELLSNKQS